MLVGDEIAVIDQVGQGCINTAQHDHLHVCTANIAIGFVAAFITGAIVVRYALDFITARGLSFFGWWRILVGGAGLVAIYFYGFGQGYVPPA